MTAPATPSSRQVDDAAFPKIEMEKVVTEHYAHEIAAEPTADDAPLVDFVRYHVARALGLWRGVMGGPLRSSDDRVLTVVAQSQLALLLAALHNGLVGKEAVRWAFERCNDGDAGEWLCEVAEQLGIEPMQIKGYVS